MSSIKFEPAVRAKVKLRLALIGPSGSGKTYSALALGRGLVGPTGRIALVDTEHGSGSLYATRWAYDVARLEPPFTPRRYIEAIMAASEAGYDLLVLDSLSHAWAGEGGLLEMHDQRAAATKNSFTAWRDVTPEHNRLVEAMLRAPLHLIACFRTKQAYEIVEDAGKKKVVKLGLAPVFRDGIEYEFTTVFDLNVEKHVASASKDRTELFDGWTGVLTPKHGEQLLGWLNSGVDAVAPVPPTPALTPSQAPRAVGAPFTPSHAGAGHHNGAEPSPAPPQAERRAVSVKEMVYAMAEARGISGEAVEMYLNARFGLAAEDVRQGQWLLTKRDVEGVKSAQELAALTQKWRAKDRGQTEGV